MPPALIPPNAPQHLSDAAFSPAATQSLSVVDLFSLAEKFKSIGNRPSAVDLYRTWIAYNPSSPFLYAVYFNYGVALADNSDPLGAVNALRECIRMKPDFYPPYINLGRLLEDRDLLEPAVDLWKEAAGSLSMVNGENLGHRNTILQQIGRVLEGAGDPLGAENALRLCLDLNPLQGEAAQHWISLRQGQCKWPVVVPWDRATRANLVSGIAPLSLANFSDDPLFQLAKSFRYNRDFVGIPDTARRMPASKGSGPSPGRRLKIGYLSSDLREHAVGFAMTDVMEQHDRETFEIFAYYCGIPRTDPIQERIRAAADHWTNIAILTDDAAAQAILRDGIDILVDLNGYTKSARTKVFALRPAPVMVNWFGFPGTMASPYHHYIIADDYIIPESHEIYYSEAVLRLPCYQPNDRKRTAAEARPSRVEEGLPEGAMVFCCLNGMQKLTPIVFARWMSILAQVPNSVLWLLTGNDDTNNRLRQAAVEQGVAAERLFFAQKKPNPDHLARYPLADIFLDTMPYGAHTTAADALWMGVPIVTLSGRGFASRVCGSVVRAAGLPELVCDTPEDYVAKAVELGRDRAALSKIKAKLVSGRDTCVLFDTPKLVRALETLFRKMTHDFEAGKRPVPNLENLDLYHEIGKDLELETTELLSTDAYHALYADKLAQRHDFSPVGVDGRLWTASN